MMMKNQMTKRMIINPIVTIFACSIIFCVSLKREQHLRQFHNQTINEKSDSIKSLIKDWSVYESMTEQQIVDLNKQIALLQKANTNIENSKTQIKIIYHEKYIQINDYNANMLVNEFDNIFAANDVK